MVKIVFDQGKFMISVRIGGEKSVFSSPSLPHDIRFLEKKKKTGVYDVMIQGQKVGELNKKMTLRFAQEWSLAVRKVLS